MVKKVFTLEEALKHAADYAGAANYNAAEIFYRSVLDIVPEHAEALAGLARTLAATGRQEPVPRPASPADESLGAVNALIKARRYADAEEMTQRLLAVQPESFGLYEALGKIFRSQKKYQDALAAYEKCLSLDPRSVDAADRVGFVLAKLGRDAEARPHFEAAIAANPDHPAAHYNLANVLRRLGLSQQAVAHALKAVGLQPGIPAYHVALTEILSDVGDIDTANDWAVNLALPTMKKFAEKSLLSQLAEMVSAYYSFQKVRDTEEQYARFCVPAAELFYNAVKNTPELQDSTPLTLAPPQAGKRKVAFFAETISELAHTRNLFNYTRALANHADLAIQPVLYYAECSSEKVITQYHDEGIATVKVPLSSTIEAPGLWLRQHLHENDIDTCVILGTLSALFILVMGLRVAPVQIWWSQKYHGLKLDNIDGYLTLGGFEPQRELQGRMWRCIPGLFGPEITAPVTDAEAALVDQIRATHLNDRFTMIAGVIGREEKIDNDEYWDCVAAILTKHPEIIFIWSGQSERPSITNRIAARGLTDRCRYIGWVQTKPYSNALDLYLDSFPFPGGHTLIEAIMAGKPAVSLVTKEGRRIGIPIFAEPWLKNDGGETLRRYNFEPIFAGPTGEDLLPFVPDTATYIARALALIENPGFRARWVAASRRFVLEYLTDMNRAAEMLNMHILEVIRDRERVIKASSGTTDA